MADLDESFAFKSPRGETIHTKSWRATGSNAGDARGVVLIVHGLGEHCGRYHYVANRFVREGYSVYALDHHGHGKSEGERAYVQHIDNYVTDVLTYTDHIHKVEKPQKFVILGHSMGALITIMTCLRRPNFFDAVVLSGPPFDMNMNNTVTRGLIGVLASLMPRSGLIALPTKEVCGKKEVVEDYQNDPLVYHGSVKWGMVKALYMAQVEALSRARREFMYPFLLVHGTDDKLCPASGGKLFFHTAGSPDKKLILYDDMLHEIMNEEDRDKVLDDIVEWLDPRCPCPAQLRAHL